MEHRPERNRLTLEQFNALNEMLYSSARPDYSFTVSEYCEMCEANGKPKTQRTAEYGLKKLVADGKLMMVRCMVASADGTMRSTNCYYFEKDANRTVESGAGLCGRSETGNRRDDTGKAKAGQRRPGDTGREIE